MNIAFVTCVKLGESCIRELINSKIKIKLIITLNDDIAVKKSGRIYLDNFCKKNHIQLLKIDNINDEIVMQNIKLMNIDWLFIIGWSQIAGKSLLKAPNKGCLGIHPTLLPEGRGRASIPWAILKNLKITGASLFKLDHGIDTGPIINQVQITINEKENANTLYNKIIKAHIFLIKKVAKNLLENNIIFRDQIEKKATYWPQRKPEDGQIDLNGSVYDAERLIRATTKPYPGAYYYDNNLKIKVWEAEITSVCRHNELSLSFKDGYLKLISIE
jgi:methionyl-tRNA formyltransferase